MTRLHGFTLIETRTLAELNAEAALYRHDTTGAELLSITSDDENKVFGITFRTPPTDSTGIAHILEHSVLCGSRKYSLKAPFVELLKGSLQTFLNAMTYPDKTIYPVASTNLRDFYNLVDVYLDSVLQPLITPDILRQEGWHYELPEGLDGPLAYSGVVFNEMKGAYASPDSLLFRAIQQSLFPDTTYGVDSGGNPANILDLHYPQFKAFHETYYHPSNARVFFYGDDPTEERLRLMNTAFSGFTRQPVTSTIALQQPFTAPKRIVRSFPAAEGSANRHMVTVNWMLHEPVDVELGLALGILEHLLLGSAAAPLRRALIDSGLGEGMTGSGFNDLQQSIFTTGLKGVSAEHVDTVADLIVATLARIADGGIEPSMVEASLNTIEFRLRENNTGGYPRGLSLMMRALDTWLYDGDPFAPLAFEAPLAAVKARLAADPRWFETLIGDLLVANQHRVTVVLAPDTEQGEREALAERERLAREYTACTRADLEQIAADAARLKAMQEASDPPERLALLPSLTRADLEPQIRIVPGRELSIAGVRTIHAELFTNGIVYLDLGLNLHTLPQELLPYINLFCRALLETGTAHATVAEFTQRIGRSTGGIGVSPYTAALRDQSVASAWLFMRGKATLANVPELLAIMNEVLRTARLDNRERFRQIVLESKVSSEAGLVPGGHTVVASRLRAQFSEADWAAEQIGGVSYLLMLRQLVAQLDNDWPSVLAALEAIRTHLVRRGALVVNVTADAPTFAAVEPALKTFLAALPAGEAPAAVWQPHRASAPEGFSIPAQVNYVGKGANLYQHGFVRHGSALVVTRYLRTSYLWDKVRVQGGAYGGFSVFDINAGTFGYLSYRDPNVLATLDIYDRTGDFLRNLRLNDQELTRALIGAISDLDSYQLPDARGFTAALRRINGVTDDERQRLRDEVLSTTEGHFHAFAAALDAVRDNGWVTILGGEAALTAAVAARPGLMTVTRLL